MINDLEKLYDLAKFIVDHHEECEGSSGIINITFYKDKLEVHLTETCFRDRFSDEQYKVNLFMPYNEKSKGFELILSHENINIFCLSAKGE